MLAPNAAIVVILRHAGRCESVRVEEGTGARCGATRMLSGCGMGLPPAGYLEVCQFTAAAATSGFNISARGVAIVEGVHVGVALAATMHRTSLERYAT